MSIKTGSKTEQVPDFGLNKYQHMDSGNLSWFWLYEVVQSPSYCNHRLVLKRHLPLHVDSPTHELWNLYIDPHYIRQKF